MDCAAAEMQRKKRRRGGGEWRGKRVKAREMRPEIDHAICRISHAQKRQIYFRLRHAPHAPPLRSRSFVAERFASPRLLPAGRSSHRSILFQEQRLPSVRREKPIRFHPFTTYFCFGFISALLDVLRNTFEIGQGCSESISAPCNPVPKSGS